MLKTKEFQTHVIDLEASSVSYKCPICGYKEYGIYSLPKRCGDCGAIFEWKVLVHYEEKEEESIT